MQQRGSKCEPRLGSKNRQTFASHSMTARASPYPLGAPAAAPCHHPLSTRHFAFQPTETHSSNLAYPQGAPAAAPFHRRRHRPAPQQRPAAPAAAPPAGPATTRAMPTVSCGSSVCAAYTASHCTFRPPATQAAAAAAASQGCKAVLPTLHLLCPVSGNQAPLPASPSHGWLWPAFAGLCTKHALTAAPGEGSASSSCTCGGSAMSCTSCSRG